MPGLSFVFRLPSQIPIDLALVKPLGDEEGLGMSFDVGKVSSHACHFFLLIYDCIGENNVPQQRSPNRANYTYHASNRQVAARIVVS